MSLNAEHIYGGSLSLTKAGLAAGATAGTFKTTASLTYAVNGIFATAKAATDNVALTSGHAAVPPSSGCAFAVWIDASGAFSTTQGAVVSVEGTSSPVPLPGFAPDRALVGLIKVITNTSTTFTPGTTALGAAGVTTAYRDCALMPGAPI